MSTRVLYPGSFDPPTLGHEEVLARSVALFDHVIVGVAESPEKGCWFTLDERVALFTSITSRFGESVSVLPLTGLTAHFAQAQKVNAIIRGIRNGQDLGFEVQMAELNRSLSDIDTVFLTPTAAVQHISSTFVREIARLGGDITPFVSPAVADAMLNGANNHG